MLEIRHVALIGGPGVGKTTLLDAVLSGTGAIERAGAIAGGTTVSDQLDAERAAGQSIAPTRAFTEVEHPRDPARRVRLTVLDVPSAADVRAALAGVEAALIVVSAEAGPDEAARAVWAAAADLTRMLVVTHLDRPGADFAATVQECQRVFGPSVQAVGVPVTGPDGLASGEPTGVVELMSWTLFDESTGVLTLAPAGNDLVQRLLPARVSLVERVLEAPGNDRLLARHRAGQRVAYHAVVASLEAAAADGHLAPAVPVVPVSGLGVRLLVELIVLSLPAPQQFSTSVEEADGNQRTTEVL